MGPTGQVSVVQSAFNRDYAFFPVLDGDTYKLETGEIPFLGVAGDQGQANGAGSAYLPPLVPILSFLLPELLEPCKAGWLLEAFNSLAWTLGSFFNRRFRSSDMEQSNASSEIWNLDRRTSA